MMDRISVSPNARVYAVIERLAKEKGLSVREFLIRHFRELGAKHLSFQKVGC